MASRALTNATREPAQNGRTAELHYYLQLINQRNFGATTSSDTSANSVVNYQTSPMFSWRAKDVSQRLHGLSFQQFALIGHLLEGPLNVLNQFNPVAQNSQLDPVFINTNVPFSAFICGKQGSGKSYTLSCMLEGCLFASRQLGKLPKPLGGIVFNYDSQAVNVAEAAHLCSAGIPVTVFVSPSNQKTMEAAYRAIPGSNQTNLKVKPLFLKPTHLTTERMKRLMAFGDSTKDPPLYMQVCWMDPSFSIDLITNHSLDRHQDTSSDGAG